MLPGSIGLINGRGSAICMRRTHRTRATRDRKRKTYDQEEMGESAMRTDLRLGSLAGISIEINISWLIIVVLLTATLATG